MPMYESRCLVCDKEHNYITSVADYLKTPDCCGQPTKKEIRTNCQGAPVFDDLDFRLSSGEYVRTKKQRTEVMKRNNYVEAPPIEDWKPPKVDKIGKKVLYEELQKLK